MFRDTGDGLVKMGVQEAGHGNQKMSFQGIEKAVFHIAPPTPVRVTVVKFMPSQKYAPPENTQLSRPLRRLLETIVYLERLSRFEATGNPDKGCGMSFH